MFPLTGSHNYTHVDDPLYLSANVYQDTASESARTPRTSTSDHPTVTEATSAPAARHEGFILDLATASNDPNTLSSEEPPSTISEDAPAEFFEDVDVPSVGLERRGTSGSIANTSFESGEFITEVHGSCPRCHHMHYGTRVVIEHGRYTGVRCTHCRKNWFGLGRSEEPRFDLLSRETLPLDKLEEEPVKPCSNMAGVATPVSISGRADALLADTGLPFPSPDNQTLSPLREMDQTRSVGSRHDQERRNGTEVQDWATQGGQAPATVAAASLNSIPTPQVDRSQHSRRMKRFKEGFKRLCRRVFRRKRDTIQPPSLSNISSPIPSPTSQQGHGQSHEDTSVPHFLSSGPNPHQAISLISSVEAGTINDRLGSPPSPLDNQDGAPQSERHQSVTSSTQSASGPQFNHSQYNPYGVDSTGHSSNRSLAEHIAAVRHRKTEASQQPCICDDECKCNCRQNYESDHLKALKQNRLSDLVAGAGEHFQSGESSQRRSWRSSLLGCQSNKSEAGNTLDTQVRVRSPTRSSVAESVKGKEKDKETEAGSSSIRPV